MMSSHFWNGRISEGRSTGHKVKLILIIFCVTLSVYFVFEMLFAFQKKQSIVNSNSQFHQYLLWAGLASCIPTFFIIKAIPRWLRITWFRRKYDSISLEKIENNDEYGKALYSSIINMRIKYGCKWFYSNLIQLPLINNEKYISQVIWIDEILGLNLNPSQWSRFVLQCVLKNTRGKVFIPACYITGIPNNSLKSKEQVLFHVIDNQLELWSSTKLKPCSVLSTRGIELKFPRTSKEYASFKLLAIDAEFNKRREIEFRFYSPVTTRKNGYKVYNEDVSMNLLNQFHTWIDEVASEAEEYQRKDFGSKFTSISEAGDRGEELVCDFLEKWRGDIISGYITTDNIFYNGKNFELDFLIFVDGLGLIVAEVKYYSGSIFISSEENWLQDKQGIESNIKNHSLQVVRTTSILEDMLDDYGLSHWPVVPLVIYTHPSARITKEINKGEPQCDVITLDMLKGWIAENKATPQAGFLKQDFEKIKNILKENEQEYIG